MHYYNSIIVIDTVDVYIKLQSRIKHTYMLALCRMPLWVYWQMWEPNS